MKTYGTTMAQSKSYFKPDLSLESSSAIKQPLPWGSSFTPGYILEAVWSNTFINMKMIQAFLSQVYSVSKKRKENRMKENCIQEEKTNN